MRTFDDAIGKFIDVANSTNVLVYINEIGYCHAILGCQLGHTTASIRER